MSLQTNQMNKMERKEREREKNVEQFDFSKDINNNNFHSEC